MDKRNKFETKEGRHSSIETKTYVEKLNGSSKKITMTCSQVLQTVSKNGVTTNSQSRRVKKQQHDNGESSPGCVTNFHDTFQSPTNALPSYPCKLTNRKGSDMNYSSLANNKFNKIPSAKTISDHLFLPVSSESSLSTASVGLVLNSDVETNSTVATDKENNSENYRATESDQDNVHQRNHGNVHEIRKRGLRQNLTSLHQMGCSIEKEFLCEKGGSLSPETLRIMEEVENAYHSSPIPSNYIHSPPKNAQALPTISLRKSKTVGDNKLSSGRNVPNTSKESGKPTLPKIHIEASVLLTKAGTERKELCSGLKRNDPAENAPNRDQLSSRDRLPALAEKASKHPMPTKNQGLKDLTEEKSYTNKGDDTLDKLETFVPIKLGKIDQAKQLGMHSENKSIISDGRSSSNPSPVTVISDLSASLSKKTVPLAVQREKLQRKQRLSGSKDDTDGRCNLDKRTARLRYADYFRADILQYRMCNPHLNNGSNHCDNLESLTRDRELNGISIVIRKRPIFDYELDRGDYDVVSIDNSSDGVHDICIVHNCVMHADMKQMIMKPSKYPVTVAFDELCSDEDIYKHIAEPLVVTAANDGISTILMYGQTGCGKSHTMSGIEMRCAHGLFRILASMGSEKSTFHNIKITIQFVELCGRKECKDLLDPKSKEVKLLDNDDGSVQLVNATTLDVTSPSDLLSLIGIAKGRRATEATEKNGVSSRSHSVCQIQIKGKKRGVLTLIDCAGSERRHDSMYHSSERQKESTEINASLWALKECIRARADGNSRIPYRSSTLTRILRESLEREDAKLCVIGCVAPNATDTEHTMETLKTVLTLVGLDDKIHEEKARTVAQTQQSIDLLSLPKNWTHENLKKFLTHKKMTCVKLSEKHDGKALMKMSISQMRAQLFEDRDKEMAEKLFDLLRRENDRVSKTIRTKRVNISNVRKGRS